MDTSPVIPYGLLRDRQFRPDLYYRLNVIRIDVPPLRELREDLGVLVDLFVARALDRQMPDNAGRNGPLNEVERSHAHHVVRERRGGAR